jgi:hypothetical protein
LSKVELVDRLETFRHSSYLGYVKAAAEEPWISYDLRKRYGTPAATARRRYRAYVHACLTEDDRPLLDAMRASRYAVGSERFVAKIEDELRGRRTGQPTDRDVQLPRKLLTPDEIARAVAEAYGIDAAVLRQHGRRAGEAKAVALELACRHTDLNQRQIGRHFGNITSMAVSMARRRFREPQSRENASLRKRLQQLEADLVGSD